MKILKKFGKWVLEESVMVLLFVLSVSLCLQGWLIRDCRITIAQQQAEIKQLADQQGKLNILIMELEQVQK